ncbi:uncharacterized protein LOC135943262 [Cloeon dipterum]|uniref:uncharacterized protein LOC135943262 n=1 Tax=Cloeon dipterum TaxID=197152 RepID=UPI00322005D1
MSAEQRIDDQLVELTTVRLQNLMRKQRLEVLALQFIASNFQLNEDLNLPSEIREKLLQRILQWKCFAPKGNLEQFGKMMQALPHLVGERTVSVDFTNMFTFCPIDEIKSSFIQVCELLAQFAPKIEELSMKSSPKLFIQNLLRPLTKMQKLKILRLGCCHFDPDGLIKLSRALPSLWVLGVKSLVINREISGCGNNLLSSALQHLRVLEDDNWRIRLLSFYARVAPQLDYTDASQRDEDTTACLQEDEDKTPNQQRKFLYLHCDEEYFDGKEQLHVKYPFITRLHVGDVFINLYGVGAVDKFSHLKTLVLHSCDLAHVEYLMSVYGQNLRTLHMVYDEESPLEGLTFGRILECCPRLEELKLSNVIIPNSVSGAFPELRSFIWENSSEVDYVMPLLSILSSPKLEEIKLEGLYREEDLRGAATLIEQKMILRHLQSLHLNLVHTVDPDFNFAHFGAASRLAKTASAFLPFLVDVHLSMMNDCILLRYDEVVDQVVSENFQDEAMDMMTKEFEKFAGVAFKP